MNVIEAVKQAVFGCKACEQKGKVNIGRDRIIVQAKEEGQRTGQRIMVIGILNGVYVFRKITDEITSLQETEYISAWYRA